VFDLTLTFDNGPEPGVTPRVLDILGQCAIKTTFFGIDEGVRFHQDFPPDCVPIHSGEIVRSIEPYVSSIEEDQKS
jgi:peptidoglycan/xylan/chitin deacetylase (PgdA/CDA1 family)